jgi:hypothetical protein
LYVAVEAKRRAVEVAKSGAQSAQAHAEEKLAKDRAGAAAAQLAVEEARKKEKDDKHQAKKAERAARKAAEAEDMVERKAKENPPPPPSHLPHQSLLRAITVAAACLPLLFFRPE